MGRVRFTTATGLCALLTGCARPEDPLVGQWVQNPAATHFASGVSPRSDGLLTCTPAAGGVNCRAASVLADGRVEIAEFTARFDGAPYSVSGIPDIDSVRLVRIGDRVALATFTGGDTLTFAYRITQSSDNASLTIQSVDPITHQLQATSVGYTRARPVDGAAAASTAVSPVVQLDHIMFFATDYATLIALLADTLGLPLVWPEPGSPSTRSSGVAFGNVDLEVIHVDEDEPGVGNFALEAREWSSLPRTLAQRGVATLDVGIGPVDSTRLQDGPRWSVLTVRGIGMFFVQYHHLDTRARRAKSARELARRAGGAIGVLRMTEVVRSRDSLTVTAARVTRLLGAPEPGTYTWHVGDGPSITFVSKDDAPNGRIVAEVRSLDDATRALDSLRIAYTRSRSEIHLDQKRLQGLYVVLRERS